MNSYPSQVSKVFSTAEPSILSTQSETITSSASPHDASVTSTQTLSAENSEQNELLQCSHCSKVFQKIPELRRHAKIHDSNLQSHQCTNCGKRFPERRDLIRHLYSRHGLETPQRYLCPFDGCTYALTGTHGGFDRLDNAKRHIKRRHHQVSAIPVLQINRQRRNEE